MKVEISECRIEENPEVDTDVVTLWWVNGLKGYWPTKTIAEMRARECFPDEDPDQRYARIYFTIFVQEV